MAKRGKQGDARYASVSGRIPKKLRTQFKAKIADYDDTLTVDIFLERVIGLWVTGSLEIGQPNDTPAPVTSEVYEPLPVATDAPTVASEPTHAPTMAQDDTDAPIQSSEPTDAPTDDTPPMSLAAIRDKLGMSQRQFASVLNITQASLSRYERGVRVTPARVMAAARDALQHSD